MSGRPNPYVGPRSLRAGERLYGRDRELERLFHLLLAQRIVLLYSPSGAGKTSLLQAGLLPRLRAEGFHVHPVLRVGTPPPAGLTAIDRYSLSALLSLEDDGEEANNLDLAALSRHSLASYLERRRAERSGDPEAPEVLIIDQFEEILTTDPTATAARQAFFAGLGAALRDARVWLIASMREDYIAGLDPYRDALPTGLRATFRLDLLGREAALAAVRGPAEAAGVRFEPDAAGTLVDDLRVVHVQGLDGSVTTERGPHVEPVHLQVVCEGLWRRLGADERTIGASHLRALGDVDAALASYYDAQVEAAARASATPERTLRQWIGRRLVTAAGLRTQVLQTPASTQGLANAALQALVDAHLLRTDTRRGMTWFELAHDRIVRPLLASNARWLAARLSEVQRQAELWDSQGRPEALLLATAAEAAGHLAAPEERSEVERAFLAESARVRGREESARRNLRLLRLALGILALLAVAGLIAGIVLIRREGARALAEAHAAARTAEEKQRAAEAEQRAAEERVTRQLVAQISLYRDESPELAALLGVAAAERLADPWERKGALLSALTRAPHLVARRSAPGEARLVKVSSGRGGLVGLDHAGQVWSLAEAQATPLLPAELRAVDVAVHPREPWLAIGEAGGRVTLWDLAERRARAAASLPAEAQVRDDAVWIEGLAFSADGGSLLAVRRGKLAVGYLLAAPNWTPRRIGVLPADLRGPADLGLSPEGRRLVVGGGEADGKILVIATDTGERTPLRPDCVETPCPMRLARFDPGGGRLLTGGDGALALWQVARGEIVGAPRIVRLGAGEVVLAARFRDDGTIAAATNYGISLWDATTLAPRGTPIELPARVSALAATGAKGELLAASFEADAPVRIFDPQRLAPRGVTPTFWEGSGFRHGPVAAALDPSGSRAAIFDYDGTQRVGVVKLLGVDGTTRDAPPLAGGQALAMQWTPAGALVVADAEGKVSTWTPGAAWTTLGALPARPLALALGLDESGGVTVATREQDGLHVSAGEGLTRRTKLDGPATDLLALAPGARRLALAHCTTGARPGVCDAGQVEVREVDGSTGPASPALALDTVPTQVVWSSDARRLAVAGSRVRVWDLAEGRAIPLRVPRGVGAIAFSADGRVLAGAAAEGNATANVALWDLDTGEELAPALRLHNPAVGDTPEGQVMLSADGGLLLSSRCDGVVLWDLSEAALRREACALAGREPTPAEQARFFGSSGAPICRAAE